VLRPTTLVVGYLVGYLFLFWEEGPGLWYLDKLVKTIWSTIATFLVALSNWLFGDSAVPGGSTAGAVPHAGDNDELQEEGSRGRGTAFSTTTYWFLPAAGNNRDRAVTAPDTEGGPHSHLLLKRNSSNPLTSIMWKVIQQGTKSLILFLSKIWNFILYFLRKNGRKVMQHQTIKYDNVPLSPLSKHRLSLVKRKVLVLDLDETLIHSHHDGVQRYYLHCQL